ncbi:hypothetical protein HYQ44_007665 [Verticillium longisporum]|nr:hypothetical protein HYQ44_007665 [Verticillium longisporum]
MAGTIEPGCLESKLVVETAKLRLLHRRLSTYHVPRYLEARTPSANQQTDSHNWVTGVCQLRTPRSLSVLSSSGACLPATKHSFVCVLERAC